MLKLALLFAYKYVGVITIIWGTHEAARRGVDTKGARHKRQVTATKLQAQQSAKMGPTTII